jgi:diguanylate cyclase (GGDEF)-like protein
MYSIEYLSSFPYFREILSTTELPAIHDSLTGLIARPYLLGFVKAMIAEKTPFTLAILDLDNFKSINDNYGHKTGDDALRRIAEELRGYVGRDGMVGRFGGDEFLIVNIKSNAYNDIHDFYENMFKQAFRQNLYLDNVTLFPTATIGSAAFPEDAGDFDTLFSLIDKTLYRGKSKGRNCYIIYVESKHAHLEIPKLAKRSLYDTFRNMAFGFDSGTDILSKLRQAFDPVRENLRLPQLLLVNEKREVIDVESGAVLTSICSLDNLIENGLYAPGNFDELRVQCPELTELLSARRFETILIALVGSMDKPHCFLLVCPDVRSQHIWQDEEFAVAYFLSRMLEQYLQSHKPNP